MELGHKDQDDLRKLLDKSISLSNELQFLYNLLIELGLSVNMIIVIVLIGEDLNSADIEELYGDWSQLIDNNSEIDGLRKVKEKLKTLK